MLGGFLFQQIGILENINVQFDKENSANVLEN